MVDVFVRDISAYAKDGEYQFHDVWRSSAGKLNITVGQLAGSSPIPQRHGTLVREALRRHAHFPDEDTLGTLFASLNRRLSQSGGAVNVFSCTYDASGSALQFVNAGLATALLVDSGPDQRVLSLRAGGLGLGTFEIAQYLEGLLLCDPDALLVVSTQRLSHGNTTASGATRRERLQAILERHRLDSLSRIAEAMVRPLTVDEQHGVAESEATLVLARLGT